MNRKERKNPATALTGKPITSYRSAQGFNFLSKIRTGAQDGALAKNQKGVQRLKDSQPTKKKEEKAGDTKPLSKHLQTRGPCSTQAPTIKQQVEVSVQSNSPQRLQNSSLGVCAQSYWSGARATILCNSSSSLLYLPCRKHPDQALWDLGGGRVALCNISRKRILVAELQCALQTGFNGCLQTLG